MNVTKLNDRLSLCFHFTNKHGYNDIIGFRDRKDPLAPYCGSVPLLCIEKEETNRARAAPRKEGERGNIVCEGKDKICADSFLARGPEH